MAKAPKSLQPPKLHRVSKKGDEQKRCIVVVVVMTVVVRVARGLTGNGRARENAVYKKESNHVKNLFKPFNV